MTNTPESDDVVTGITAMSTAERLDALPDTAKWERELAIRAAQPATFAEWLDTAQYVSDARLAPIAAAMHDEDGSRAR